MTAPRPSTKPLATTLRPRKELEAQGYRFDKEAVDRVVTFFSYLPHIKGQWAGKPFILQPWQLMLVTALFGWKRKDGTRLFREMYLEVPRKNGKSTLAAGIAGYCTYADREPGAEVYSAAVDREQAGIVFGTLSEMVLASDQLKERSKVYRRSIFIPQTRAVYKVLSADAPNKHGLNASAVIVDELHAHPNRELFDVLTTSMGSRTQPLFVSITTAGVWTPESIGYDKHEYTHKVASHQVKDDAFLGVIYGAAPEDDWRDPKTAKKANPGYGTQVSPENIAREVAKAEASVAYQNTVRMLYFNQWMQQSTRWIDLGMWDENASSVIEPDLVGRQFYGGLDLGRVSDLTAWLMAFPNEPGQCKAKGHEDGGCVSVLARFFCPEAALEAGKQNAALYQQWRDQGLMEVTPGNATDYRYVQERIVGDCSKFEHLGINADFLFQGAQLVSELLDEGLQVTAMRQTPMAFALPMREFERLLLERKLHHGGNPILRWMADNIVVRSDSNGNIKPDKEKSKEKIDGIVALVMALEPLTREQAAEPLAAWL